MSLFEYKPLNIPLIEALPAKLLEDRQAKLGELSLYEREQAAIEAVVDLRGMGGELALERTVVEATAYNHSRRVPQQREPEPFDYGNAS